ncbi:hypothetical protein K8R47_00525 [archaeon]|nr:hypothetical protein [archaeon]
MKKYIFLILAIFLVIGITGCKEYPNEPQTTDFTDKGTTTPKETNLDEEGLKGIQEDLDLLESGLNEFDDNAIGETLE